MKGRRHRPVASNQDTSFEDGRLIRLAMSVVALYLFIGFMPLMRWSAANHNWLPLVAHVVALSVCVVFALGDLPRLFRPVRDWLGIALIFFMYFDLRYIVSGIGFGKKDDTIVALDRTLFHGDLWATLAQRVHVAPVSELLHLAYLSYYPLIVVPPFLLWRKDRRHEFTLTMFTLLVAYVLCFSGAIIMPVDGPRFVSGPADAPSGPIRALALSILQIFSSHGSAFPSSHMAAAVAATYCAWRFQRRVGYVAALCTLGIGAGAVYGGLHYVTDIVAGVVVGAIAALIMRAVERRPGKPREEVEREAAIPKTPVNVQIVRERMAQHNSRRALTFRKSTEVQAPEAPPKVEDPAKRE